MTAQPETLSDYLARRKAKEKQTREPRWIVWSRQNQQKATKDLTGPGPDAA